MEDIKTARTAAGLTQAQVVELIGIPRRTLQDWENERRRPPDWVARLVIEKLASHKKSTPEA